MDEKNIEISLYEVVGSHLCAAPDDGQKVYERLAAALNRNLPVSLSFRNISVLTPTFLKCQTVLSGKRGFGPRLFRDF